MSNSTLNSTRSKSKYRPLHLVQLLGLFVVLVGHEAAAYSSPLHVRARLTTLPRSPLTLSTTSLSSTSTSSGSSHYQNNNNNKKNNQQRFSRLHVASVTSADFFSSPSTAGSRNDTTTTTRGFLGADDTAAALPVEFFTDQPELHQKQQPLEETTTITTTAKPSAETTTTTKLPPISNIDIGTFGIHFCAAVTMTLPVMIVPMMDAEIAATKAAIGGVAAATSLAATMASMAPMGNGLGKLVNGVVCQQMGGPKSSRLYFGGSALASLALASVTLTATSGLLTPHHLGAFVAAIEFCASIQWTVCSLFLSQYYKGSPALFARGITILSLSSTGGQIASKLVGAALLQFVHWRHVARISVAAAIVGLQLGLWTSRNMANAKEAAIVAKTAIVDAAPVIQSRDKTTHQQQQQSSSSSASSSSSSPEQSTSIRQAVGRVLGSKVFWLIGLAHVSGYLTRTSDRILGTFLQEITSLSPQICGGLTAFMTVGFLYGLVSTSRKFHQPPATHNDSDDDSSGNAMIQHKLRLLRNGYIRYLVSAGGLVASAAFGRQWHPYVSAGIITTCASIMASSIAFPFFQVPNMVSSIYFGEVKPVALSLIDGTGVFLTSPIWKIFTGMLLPTFGWSLSWSVVAMTVGLCGTLLMRTMPKVLQLQHEQDVLQQKAQP